MLIEHLANQSQHLRIRPVVELAQLVGDHSDALQISAVVISGVARITVSYLGLTRIGVPRRKEVELF